MAVMQADDLESNKECIPKSLNNQEFIPLYAFCLQLNTTIL